MGSLTIRFGSEHPDDDLREIDDVTGISEDELEDVVAEAVSPLYDDEAPEVKILWPEGTLLETHRSGTRDNTLVAIGTLEGAQIANFTVHDTDLAETSP